MSFPDITAELKAGMPQLRGRLLANQVLKDLTWFRVGGPAQVLFMPEDEADLAYLLERLPAEVPVSPVGLGSNLIVRDGGVPGVVVRLGRGFAGVVIEGDRVRAGAAVPDLKVAQAAQESRTGGSTFKNPPGQKAWQLIHQAGCRGMKLGEAQVSEMHCNFLINLGNASAADIESLGELVRRRVKETSRIELEWEIRRIGLAKSS